MKLLPSTLPAIRELFHNSGWFTFGVVLALVGLEVFGRNKSDSDLTDGPAACGLLVLLIAVAWRHRQSPLVWVDSLWSMTKRVGSTIEGFFKLELGLDLRGTPPIPRRMPRAFFGIFAALFTWNLLALLAWSTFIEGWRSIGVQVFYVGYLVVLLGLWALLFSALLIGVYFPMSVFYQTVLSRADGSPYPRAGLICLFSYLTLIVVAESFLSPLVIVATCGVLFALALAVIAVPAYTPVQFIWRSAVGQPVWSVPSLRLIASATVLMILLHTALILSACAGRILAREPMDSHMPVTVLLGSVLAWLTPGIVVSGLIVLSQLWRQNPARTSRRLIYVTGQRLVEDGRQTMRWLRRAGWRTQTVTGPIPATSVGIELVTSEQSQAIEFDPQWPLKVHVDDLQNSAVFERLSRREELQVRRQFIRGLEKLFKQAAGKHFSGGSGYWLAPHLWFISGLTRDESEPESEQDNQSDIDENALLLRIIGAPYHRLYPARVRQYIYQMLRALQVDLIFIEDGVSFRKLTRVLRAMFEVYDRNAGKSRAEEVHFAQVPKVRVLIHEFQIDQPFRSEVYPEPKFEDLGRARILHVFRDRGGQEDPLETPYDFEWSPSPLALV